MPILNWDKPGTKVFEAGVSKGVLYLPDGSAVPWNGLTSVTETTPREVRPIYFNGRKFLDLASVSNFSATMTAVTYPDEFVKIEGTEELAKGVFIGEQVPKMFNLSYQTRMGNETDYDLLGYKIHIIYNVTALPADKAYTSLSSEATYTEFEWELSTIPQEIPGHKPTSRLTIDSRTVDPSLLVDIERLLYGGPTANAQLPPFEEMVKMLSGFFRIEIIDNKDGTWTAYSEFDELIVDEGFGEFTIYDATFEVVDDDTIAITDTKG
jgi:hypothetical protein